MAGLRTVDVDRDAGVVAGGVGDGVGVYVYDVEAAAFGYEGGRKELDSGELDDFPFPLLSSSISLTRLKSFADCNVLLPLLLSLSLLFFTSL